MGEEDQTTHQKHVKFAVTLYYRVCSVICWYAVHTYVGSLVNQTPPVSCQPFSCDMDGRVWFTRLCSTCGYRSIRPIPYIHTYLAKAYNSQSVHILYIHNIVCVSTFCSCLKDC